MDEKIDKSFLGTGWSFPPSYNDQNHSFEMVSELDDIRQSLFILISTAPGERILNPTYGCDLFSLVFEPINDSTRFEISSMVRLAIVQFEPRVIVNEVDVEIISFEPGILHILVEFTVKQTNSRSNIVYPFYLQEGTNL